MNALEQMKQVEAALDEYESSSNLPVNISPGSEDELQEYLNMDRTAITALSCLECGTIGIRLAQYSIYTQRLYNRESARVVWATGAIINGSASSWNSYSDFIKYDMKMALIGKENEYVAKLNKIIAYAKQRMERLEYVSSGLKYMADVLVRQQRYKESKDNG